ncbi:MAG: hypothetical protein BSOLF_1070 [Candidatus Carbobacillus altaicus]|uniref:Uncharacterized protein n=1 Tax=Candidatus Carbonibacillus altaicus TaxID=2163959 RepID=A0A2R6XZX7_9BACL|nr:MAG: hypothetical protein BSOLF_1070 [Candidatus Carbobacillus altaicus]
MTACGCIDAGVSVRTKVQRRPSFQTMMRMVVGTESRQDR